MSDGEDSTTGLEENVNIEEEHVNVEESDNLDESLEENVNMEEDVDPCEEPYPPKVTTRHMHRKRMAAEAAAASASSSNQTADQLSTRPKFLNTRVRCPYGCNKVLAQRTIDYHRTNGCRMGQEEPFADSQRKKNYCCGVCFTEFVTRTAFFAHLSEDHDVNASIHHLSFENKHMFMRFVRWLEAEGGAHFRHKSGAKRRASGKGIFMACNRSGYVGRSLSDPVRNKTGNFRTGYTCTGFIHGTEHNDGTITIEFCGDHYGHDARMRLPNIVKQLIAQKQMDGETFMEIINYLRRQFAPFSNDCIYAQRVCLVDLDELRTLLVTTTRKWEQTGIPAECEIWEEELLERAGISREGVPSIRKDEDKPTAVLATEQSWPRPSVFTAKMKVNGGYVELPELNKATAETRRDVSLLQTKTSVNSNVFRQQLPTVSVSDDDDSDIEISVDQNSPEKDDKINVETTPPPSPQPNAQEIEVSSPLRKPHPRMNNKPLTREQCIATMSHELNGLDNLIKSDANGASGTFLVAFLTRIRQLKTSFINGITPSNQPMSEQHRLLQEGADRERISPEVLQQEDDDICELIGTDYPDEDFEAKLVDMINEQLPPDQQMEFIPHFWA